MRHRKQQNPNRADIAPLARYARDLTCARLLLAAQIRRGDVKAVHVQRWLFGADELDGAA